MHKSIGQPTFSLPFGRSYASDAMIESVCLNQRDVPLKEVHSLNEEEEEEETLFVSGMHNNIA